MEFCRLTVCAEVNKTRDKRVVNASSFVICLLPSRETGLRQKLLFKDINNLSRQFINLDALKGREILFEEHMVTFYPGRLKHLK